MPASKKVNRKMKGDIGIAELQIAYVEQCSVVYNTCTFIMCVLCGKICMVGLYTTVLCYHPHLVVLPFCCPRISLKLQCTANLFNQNSLLCTSLSAEKFHQYDTMIYPPPEFMLKQLFKGMVSGQESHEHPEIQCPPPELMRQTCLIYYLKVHEPLLNSESMPESAAVLISDVVHIYAQLAEHLLCVQSRVPGQPPSYEPWPVDNSKNVSILIILFCMLLLV